MNFRHATIYPTVIPANAGIQCNTSCEALKTNNVCCARVPDWIPAFAGMTKIHIRAENDR